MTANTAPTLNGTDFEADVREFVAWANTQNTRRMVRLASAGVISWEEAYGLCVKVLEDARQKLGM